MPGRLGIRVVREQVARDPEQAVEYLKLARVDEHCLGRAEENAGGAHVEHARTRRNRKAGFLVQRPTDEPAAQGLGDADRHSPRKRDGRGAAGSGTACNPPVLKPVAAPGHPEHLRAAGIDGEPIDRGAGRGIADLLAARDRFQLLHIWELIRQHQLDGQELFIGRLDRLGDSHERLDRVRHVRRGKRGAHPGDLGQLVTRLEHGGHVEEGRAAPLTCRRVKMEGGVVNHRVAPG